jgi:hypothetical protein
LLTFPDVAATVTKSKRENSDFVIEWYEYIVRWEKI